MRQLLSLERAALRRMFARPALMVLALLGAEVGALGFSTALARARGVLHVGTPEAFVNALAAVPLGLDLAIVLASVGFGAAVAAIARPEPASRLFLPALRTSAGAVSIAMVCFFVVYALFLGLVRLLPLLVDRPGSLILRAALGALALAPAIAATWTLAAGAVAAVALVGRGAPPGRALAAGLDHVQRRPLALLLWALHALVAAILVSLALALPVSFLMRPVIIAPLISATMVWTIAAFDAALGAGPRLATG